MITMNTLKKLDKDLLITSLFALTVVIELIVSSISNYNITYLTIKIITAFFALAVFTFYVRFYKINIRLIINNKRLKTTINITVLFTVCLLISLLWSQNRSFGILKIVYLLINNIPLIIGTLLISLEPISITRICYNNHPQKIFITSLVVFGLTGSMISLIISPFDQAIVYSFKITRWSHVVFGRFTGIPLLIVFMLLINSTDNIKRAGLSLLLTVFLISMYNSGFRAGMLGVILSITGWFFYNLIDGYRKDKVNELEYGKTNNPPSVKSNHSEFNNRLRGRVLKNSFAIFLTIVLTIAIMRFGGNENANKRFKSLIEFSISGNTNEGGINSRLAVYDEAFKRFLENPILGIGIGGFNSAWISSALGNKIIYPHNIALEFMVELGVPGLMFFFFLILGIFKSLSKENNYLIPFFIYALILAMFSKDIATNSMLWMFVGFIIVNDSEKILYG